MRMICWEAGWKKHVGKYKLKKVSVLGAFPRYGFQLFLEVLLNDLAHFDWFFPIKCLPQDPFFFIIYFLCNHHHGSEKQFLCRREHQLRYRKADVQSVFNPLNHLLVSWKCVFVQSQVIVGSREVQVKLGHLEDLRLEWNELLNFKWFALGI